MASESKLTLEAKQAVRFYLITLFAIPGIILTVGAFLLGYLIRDVAQSKASFEIGREARLQVDSIMSRLQEDLVEFAKETGEQRLYARLTLDDTTELTERLQSARTNLEVLNQLKDIEKFVPSIVSTLKDNTVFRDSIVKEIGTWSEQECGWEDWKQKWDLEIDRTCPANKYIKGISFKHDVHKNGTHEESVRVLCCSIGL